MWRKDTFSRLKFCVETESEVKNAKTPTWKFSPFDCTWEICPKMVENWPKWDDKKIQTQKRRALGLNEYELVVGGGIGHNKFIFKIP